ncbi:hypothetical protein Zmor_028270 [Zophobas morio]|uniref:Gustatory receptor n=1 Tax=Zophobas morio TaxID=2755281 RepID=A0AA38M2X8_9CUCU|nr:hypothetical protein Zmor_028270 [Zophobas morio]
MTPKSQKRHKNWLKILVLLTVVLHFVYFPVFPVFSVASVYYFMPTAIGLCDHLFLDDILQSISMEFSRINQELKTLATEQLYYPEMCAIDQLTLPHSDLVTLAIDINKLFDVVTISSMITWLVYAVDCVYFLVHSLVLENTNSGKVVLITFTALDGLLFVLWLSMMVRMYSRTQREANRTAELVHDVWNRCYKKINGDKKIVRGLELTSVRLFNHKLFFTAGNFFKLDETFCHMMVGAVATYVVILFQF